MMLMIMMMMMMMMLMTGVTDNADNHDDDDDDDDGVIEKVCLVRGCARAASSRIQIKDQIQVHKENTLLVCVPRRRRVRRADQN